MEKEQELQKKIDDKKEELKNLKTQELSDAEKKQKEEELNKEITELQKQLDELKKIKTQATIQKSAQELAEIKEKIKNPELLTLIKGTTLYTSLEKLGKTEKDIEEFANKINAVIRKFLDKELTAYGEKEKKGLCEGIQIAMRKAQIAQGAETSDFFANAAQGLSDNGLSAIFSKIENIINSFQKLGGPLMQDSPFASLAKRVQNLTSFLVLHQHQLSQSIVPQLLNPYKAMELVENSLREDPEKINSKEAFELFTLTTGAGASLSEEEIAKIKEIANDPGATMDQKTLENIENAISTASTFLDKRSFRQNVFMGIFDKIRGPLSLFGIKLVPSDILGTGLLGTALGAVTMDAYYLSKKKPKGNFKTETQSEIQSNTQTSSSSPSENVDYNKIKEKTSEELARYNSPVTADMVINASKKYNVPVEYLMAFMKNDSHYGTRGKGAETHNPGNVGNMDDGSTKDRGTRENGVNALAENLKERIDAYQKKFGKNTYPTIQELAQGKDKYGVKFFGVYMTDPKGPSAVATIKDELAQLGISNQQEFISNA